ncbi:MAG: flippase-like domain-containing protein [Planctomycetaceae bacterium]|jgi:uncharacterized membrane protein YbhN (UPF0104 family)|nr:flippase-like domain-containing protein [Planctomycetaceae bacterium]
MKRYLVTIFKVLIFFAVMLWVVWELNKSWGKMCEIEWRANYYWLLFSGLFYFVGYIPAAMFWRYSMWSLGQRPGVYESLRAYYIGHLGKYVPGKMLVVFLRSYFLSRERTNRVVAAAAVFLETLTMMASGAFLSALIVLIWFRGMENGLWLMLLAVLMMICAGLPVLPPIFRKLTAMIFRKLEKSGIEQSDPDIDRKLGGLSCRVMLVGWCLTILTWVLLGLSLWCVVNGVGVWTGVLWGEGCGVLARFILAASFSVVLGFVLMMPGGIGVRDFVLAQVLIIYFAEKLDNDMTLATSYAIVVAGVQRLISIIVELLAAGIMFAFKKR